MSLNEFITELEKELSVLPKDRQQEIVGNFKMQIQKAMALGDTEEYLLKILGAPSEVAKKCIAKEIIEKPEQKKEEKPLEKKEGRLPVTGHFAAEMKDKDIKQLTILGESAEIKVVTGKKFGIKFLSYTRKGKLEYEMDNGQLTFHHSGSNDVKFNTIIDFMKKRKQLKKDELVITWPEPLDMLSVNNKDGKVIVTDIEAEEFRITTEEGAIECAGLTGNYGELRSAMGALKLESSDFMNLFMETEMGKLTAAGVSSERYHLVTELGKIALDNLTADSDLKALSKMGSVSVNYREKPRFTKIVARANVGKVKNALEKNTIEKQNYRAEYMSEMGSVKITVN